jgi:hypothetical protein
MMSTAKTGVQTMNGKSEHNGVFSNDLIKDELYEEELELASGGCCNGKHHPRAVASQGPLETNVFSFD